MIDYNASNEAGTVYCDGCKNSENLLTVNFDNFLKKTKTEGWEEEKGKHYCPSCMEAKEVVEC